MGDSSGNTKLEKSRKQRILKGEATESWREKNQRKREDAKKGNFRGEEEETEQDRLSSEEGKHGPCAGNYHLGVSRNRLLMVTNPIQSNPICPICPSTRGNPLSSFHIPARYVVDIACTTR
jgi:hypothetical protein